MVPTEVQAFLTHLAVNRTVSASTRNQTLNAIAFVVREVVWCDSGEFDDCQPGAHCGDVSQVRGL